MKFEVSTVKGFQDFLSPEGIKRQQIREIIENKFKLYGFQPIETPTIEFDELMKPEAIASEVEDEAVSDRFRLKDRGGRNLGLRYEFTFQLKRIFKENPNIKLPFRRYQIGQVFRDEPTSSSRFREFTQCDVDVIGSADISTEAELLSLASDILKELGINAEIQVNNRKLMNSIIESVQIRETSQVLKEIDKLDKIGEDQVKVNLKQYADTNQVLTLFKLLEKSLEFFKENKFDGSEELQKLIDEAENYNLRLIFNPFMVRGLGYYTGNVFEVVPEEESENKGTIAAGGRYDKTVGSLIGRDIPAVGISFGLERVSSLAKVQIQNLPKVLIISIEQTKQAIKLASSLRKNNISCIISEDKPGKALEYANAMQIPYTIFLGKDEVEQKKIKLKNMSSGEEKLLAEKQLPKEIK